MAEYERRFPDCDGGWQTYMRQSMPGYQNAAFDESGAPMKNWWPFLFIEELRPRASAARARS